jgi:hypothetical protein
MKVNRTLVSITALVLGLACSLALKAQDTLKLEESDIEKVEFRGVAPTKTTRRAIVTIRVSDAAHERARASSQTLPPHISVGINGRSVDFKLDRRGFYSAQISAPRRFPVGHPTIFAYSRSGPVIGTGPSANPNFEIEFGPCAKGCKSIIFRTKCIVCIKKIGW